MPGHNCGVKKATVILLLLLAALLGYGVGVAQPFVVRGPVMLGQDAVVSDAPSKVRLADAGGDVIVVEPTDGEARVAFVLYPGGLVRPQAYEWIGHALAAHGVRTLIPVLPLDLAVLSADRAGEVAEALAPGLPVVVGGHSLGGAMAASYAADHDVSGLVLLAAYPSDSTDLSGKAFPVVSLMAQHDGVADAAKVTGGLDRLPGATRLITVDGAVHSFFGRYGPQDGDGVPTVDRAEAEAAITGSLVEFFEALA